MLIKIRSCVCPTHALVLLITKTDHIYLGGHQMRNGYSCQTSLQTSEIRNKNSQIRQLSQWFFVLK